MGELLEDFYVMRSKPDDRSAEGRTERSDDGRIERGNNVDGYVSTPDSRSLASISWTNADDIVNGNIIITNDMHPLQQPAPPPPPQTPPRNVRLRRRQKQQQQSSSPTQQQQRRQRHQSRGDNPAVQPIYENRHHDHHHDHGNNVNGGDQQLYDYSSQSTAVSQYTASNGEQSSSLDGCEISLSSASYANGDHHVLPNVMVILREGEEDKITKVYRESSAATKKKEKDRVMSGRQREQRGSSGGGKTPRERRKRLAKSRRSAPPTKGGGNKTTPVISNRKQPDAAAHHLHTDSSSNLFLQMGDDEVGNHAAHQEQTNDVSTIGDESHDLTFRSALETSYVTQSTAMNTSVSSAGSYSKTSSKISLDNGEVRVTSLGYSHHEREPSALTSQSVLGAAAEGLQFHPAVGGTSFADDISEEEDDSYYPAPIKGSSVMGNDTMVSTMASTMASTMDEEEEEEEEEEDGSYYPTPIKGTGEGGGASTKPPPKPSPDSVIDDATLTSFPRYQKNQNARSKRGNRNKSNSLILRHDSSYDDSETMAYGDDEATASLVDYDYDDDDEEDESVYPGDYYDDRRGSRGSAVASLQRALFHNTPLNKFHDYITGGNMCWSNGKDALIKGLKEGCADSSNAAVVIDEAEDYDYEDSLNGEEDTLNGEEGTLATYDDDFSVEVSLATSPSADVSMASSRIRSGRRKKKERGKEKKKQTLAKVEERRQQQQYEIEGSKSGSKSKLSRSKSKSHSRSRSRTRRPRGRSPTSKLGYNSDGESIRQSSHSRSRGSPRDASVSLSTCNSSDDGCDGLRIEGDPIVLASGGGVEELVATGAGSAPPPSSPAESASLQHGDGQTEGNVNGSPRGRDPSVSSLASLGLDPSGIAEVAKSVAEEEEQSIAESVLSHDRETWMAMTQPSPTRPSPVRYVDRDRHDDYDDGHGHDDDYNDDGIGDVYDSDGGILHDDELYGDDGDDAHYNSDGGVLTPGSRSFKARDVPDDEGDVGDGHVDVPGRASADVAALSPLAAAAAAGRAAAKERELSPYSSRDASAVEGYFKKLLSVGIQLLLNDPPTSSEKSGPRLNRAGKMFLQFGNAARPDDLGKFEHPRLLWTDGQDVSHALELLDIRSIRRPTSFELDNAYPFAIPTHSFFLTTTSGEDEDGEDEDGNVGRSLLFEAVDELQMIRVTAALRGIIGKLAKKIIQGENDWVVQMLLASSARGGGGGAAAGGICLEDLEGSGAVPCAMADVTDHLVGKTTLMRQAQERRNMLRSKARQV